MLVRSTPSQIPVSTGLINKLIPWNLDGCTTGCGNIHVLRKPNTAPTRINTTVVATGLPRFTVTVNRRINRERSPANSPRATSSRNSARSSSSPGENRSYQIVHILGDYGVWASRVPRRQRLHRSGKKSAIPKDGRLTVPCSLVAVFTVSRARSGPVSPAGFHRGRTPPRWSSPRPPPARFTAYGLYCHCLTASTAADSSSGGPLSAFTCDTSPVLSITACNTTVPSRRTNLASSGYDGGTFLTSSPSAAPAPIFTNLPVRHPHPRRRDRCARGRWSNAGDRRPRRAGGQKADPRRSAADRSGQRAGARRRGSRHACRRRSRRHIGGLALAHAVGRSPARLEPGNRVVQQGELLVEKRPISTLRGSRTRRALGADLAEFEAQRNILAPQGNCARIAVGVLQFRLAVRDIEILTGVLGVGGYEPNVVRRYDNPAVDLRRGAARARDRSFHVPADGEFDLVQRQPGLRHLRREVLGRTAERCIVVVSGALLEPDGRFLIDRGRLLRAQSRSIKKQPAEQQSKTGKNPKHPTHGFASNHIDSQPRHAGPRKSQAGAS